MAGYFNGSVYVQIADNSAMDLTSSSGWTFTAFVYPDNALIEPDFGYIYSHGQPLSASYAIQIIRGGFGAQPRNTIRVLIDWPGGTLVDFTSTNTLTMDAWNRFAITYDGGGTGNLYIAINGAYEQILPPALPNITPAGEGRIGYSVAGGTRNFPGAIAHFAKYDRPFAIAELQAYTSTFLSPEFAQNALRFHIPMFTNSVRDDQQVLTTTPQGLSWVRHGHFIYPAKFTQGGGNQVIPVTPSDNHCYFRMC